MELATAVIAGGVGAGLVGGIFSLILFRMNRKAAKEDKKDCFSAGVRVLLYDRIKHLARSYMAKGSVTGEELEDIIEMHKVYHTDLKGNGFLDNVMNQVHQLPIKN